MSGQLSTTIEFVGLPGAGKTTLAQELAQHLVAAGHLPPATSSTRRVRAMLRYAACGARHPMRLVRAIWAVCRSRQRTSKDLAWVLSRWIKKSCRSLQRASQPGVHLVDAGPLQALWAIGLTSDRRRFPLVLEELRPQWSFPDLAVFIETEPLVVEQRLARRAVRQSRLEILMREDPAAVKNAQAVLDVLRKAVESGIGDSRPKIIAVDLGSEAALQRTVQQILEILSVRALGT